MKTTKLLRINSPCPKCGGQMEFETGYSGSYFEPGLEPEFYCSECGHDPDDNEIDWANFDDPHLSDKNEKRIARLRDKLDSYKHFLFNNKRKITREDIFDSIAPEGDFSWDGEPDDVGNAWNCGDSDCESGWHQSVQCIEMGRQDGKTWLIVLEDNFAGDGDYQPAAGWDERDGDEITDSVLQDLWFHFEGRSIEHFHGWGMYCLDVAETGKDPLENWMDERKATPDNAIRSALDNLRYLHNMAKRIKQK